MTIGSESYTEIQQFLRISGAVSETLDSYGVVPLGDFTLGRPYSGVPYESSKSSEASEMSSE